MIFVLVQGISRDILKRQGVKAGTVDFTRFHPLPSPSIALSIGIWGAGESGEGQWTNLFLLYPIMSCYVLLLYALARNIILYSPLAPLFLPAWHLKKYVLQHPCCSTL